MLLMRAFLISLMDNVYHYRTPLNVTASGHNLSAPGFLAFGLLNFNLHRVHHTNPSVPWAMLPFFSSAIPTNMTAAYFWLSSTSFWDLFLKISWTFVVRS